MNPEGRPALIVVSGSPGAGKTTLAHLIARGVGCPAICRDEVREGMVHAGTPDDSMLRTNTAFFATIELLLRSGVTVVAEAAFQDRLWRPALTPLTEIATTRIIRCTLDPATATARITARLTEATRAAHNDRALLSEPERLAAWEPIALPVPTLLVDTTNGYSPTLPEIVTFAAGPGHPPL
jgi:predicted kinase